MIDNIWLVPTDVRPSVIHGSGRFSLGHLEAGVTVLILVGDVVPVTGEHMPIGDTGYCIRCPQTYINHSEHANLCLDGQILFRTSRRVDAGEELLLDYRTLTRSKLAFC